MENNRFEPFYILKEIQSLDRYIETHLLNIEDQKQRIVKLNDMKMSRHEDLLEQENNLKQLELNLQDKEILNAKISRDWAQTLEAEKVVKTANELELASKQREKLKVEKENLDKDLYQLLEQIEETELSIKSDKDFLKGIEKTLIEIGAEVQVNIALEQSKINDYELRQKLLLETLHSSFRDRFLTIRSKLKGKRPITIAKGNQCAECNFILPRQVLSDLDRGEILVGCPQCYRLLLPSTAASSKS